jgi:two-component system cell cycle response regulator CpdR
MPSSSPRILIVDDESGIRKLLSSAFGRAGYDVRTASNGVEAARLCESETFDVLLSDVRMPGMNGYELVERVTKLRPQTRSILMSGFDDVRPNGSVYAAPPCSSMAKPFNPRNAVALVDSILADTKR